MGSDWLVDFTIQPFCSHEPWVDEAPTEDNRQHNDDPASSSNPPIIRADGVADQLQNSPSTEEGYDRRLKPNNSLGSHDEAHARLPFCISKVVMISNRQLTAAVV